MNSEATILLCDKSHQFTWDLVDFTIKPKTGVYCIFEEKTRTAYIGLAKNCLTRMHLHKTLLKKGKHHAKKLQEVYEGGKLKMFAIEYVENIDTARFLEAHWVSCFGNENVLNTNTVSADWMFNDWSEECKRVSSELGYNIILSSKDIPEDCTIVSAWNSRQRDLNMDGGRRIVLAASGRFQRNAIYNAK